MVNKDEFDKKHNETTEKNQKEGWEAREQQMVAKTKEAELHKRTTEVQLQQIQLEKKIQSARARGGYEHLNGSDYDGVSNVFKQSAVGNIDELIRKSDLECRDIEALLHQWKP